MLQVLFTIAGERFGLDAGFVEEIIPLVEFSRVPGAPDYVPGRFLYRGSMVPAIDTSAHAGHGPCRVLFSTRIILVRYPKKDSDCLLGLVAQQATGMVKTSATCQASGLPDEKEPLSGEMGHDGQGLVRAFSPGEILSPEVRGLLFADRFGA